MAPSAATCNYPHTGVSENGHDTVVAIAYSAAMFEDWLDDNHDHSTG